jgi:hypothetical protein
VNQWVKLSGCTAAANNGYHKITAINSAAHTLTFAGSTFVVEGTTAQVGDVTISGSRLINGSTQRSFSIEREFADVAQFFNFRGMTVGKMGMSFQSGSIVGGSFDFMGKDGQRAGVTYMPNPATASTANEIMNAVAGVGAIYEGGSLLTSTYIKKLELSVDNKLRGRDAIGTLGNVSIGSGTLEVGGSLDVYLADGSLYDKFINDTASSISVRVLDDAGNGYIFSLSNIEYDDAKVNAGGQDQDAMISLPFVSLDSSSSGIVLQIDRVGAAAVR